MYATRLILTACLILLISSISLAGDTFIGKCVGVTDGDTIKVMRDGKAEKVRLEGIDCPEAGQDFGTKAKQFSSGLVFGKLVQLRVKTHDQYGRIIGRVYAGDVDLSLELVKAGMAWHFQKYSSERLLARAEVTARASGVGISSAHRPMPPFEYRAGRRRVSDGEPGADVYNGNIKSMVFHHFECQHCALVFQSREAAIRAGYRPCGRCKS